MLNTNPNHSTHQKILPWIIWGLGSLFYAYEFFLQVSPSVMALNLMHDLKINAGALGNLAAFYFYIYASMQIPAGIFLDTLGPRKLLSISAFICCCGALIFGSAYFLGQAQVGRLLIGLGSAFALVGTFKLIANWFDPNRFALITGMTVTIGMLGAIIGGAPLAVLVDSVGWRNSMFLLSGFGFVLFLMIWLIIRDYPHKIMESKRTANEKTFNILQSLKYVIKQKQNWFLALFGGLMFAPTSAFAALWGVPFFMAKYNIARPLAAGAVSMIFIGFAIGGPFWGWFSDFFKRRKPSFYFSSFFGMLTMSLAIYINLKIYIIYFILLLFGFFCAGFIPSFSVIREINPPNINATVLGFMNMMNMLGGAILQPLIGWVLDKYWKGIMIHHIRIFSLHSYYVALSTLPIILLIALCLVPFIKETFCQPVKFDPR